jgi:putative polyhydroxyalkanoate system protein
MRIEVRREHTLPKDEAKRRAEAITAPIRDSFHANAQWYGDRYVFHVPEGLAKDVGGYVNVDAREVHVLIDLPRMLSVLRDSVETEIRKKLAELLP